MIFNHQNSFNKYIKFGDELLIDMVRSRPYLYDKSVENYKDTTMKENTWTEIATALNITLAECKNRWLRLRQRFSKERQLREQETRSGAGKPTRQKWMLYESLTFLGRHITQRKSFSNINFTKLSEPSNVSGTSLKTQHSIILQDDYEMSTNDNSNHKTSTSTSGQQSLHTSTSKEICNTLPNMSIHKNQPTVYLEQDHDSPSPLLRRTSLATTEEISLPSTSFLSQTSASETEGSVKVSPPTSCFSGNQQ
ncbi:uncharacterized protein LOC115237392 [Formica exsecta]|uniref:uncharacterized protein LOC115237392 n=1 Tax=Formica exsecta TaxID=72781 RepID=UPI0011431D2F|nr:uncharacterized protein LOC115237392 [Formica exsecta]